MALLREELWMGVWASLHWSLRLLLEIIAASILSVIITYTQSLLRSWPGQPHEDHEPPVAPYSLPYLQHLPSFLHNPGHIFRSMHRRYAGQPFTLLMMNTKFHVFHEPTTVNHVFGQSRVFTFEPVLASMMDNATALPRADGHNFHLPSQVGGEGKDSSSFVAANHALWVKYLTGRHLDDIMIVYGDQFGGVLERHLDLSSNVWRTVNLHQLLRRIIFETSVQTFFGPRLGELWPSMWEDWNVYNDATYVGVRTNVAYIINWKAGNARERMLYAFEQWTTTQRQEEGWSEKDGIWNQAWGCKLNYEREQLARKFGFTLRGRACLHAGFLFVINVNAMAMVAWFAWCVTNSEQRLTRFREHVSKLLLRNDNGEIHGLRLDSKALKNDEYIQGLWKESLRLGTASASARVVLEDSTLEGYKVRKGSVILMPAAIMHYDEQLFPDPDRVRPERWILKDDADQAEREILQQRQRSLRPFGGGTGLCTGRMIAEQETVGVVGTLLLLCDLDFDSNWQRQYRFNPRSIGAMESAKDAIVRIRARHGVRAK